MSDDENKDKADDIGLVDSGHLADEIKDVTTDEIFSIGMGETECDDKILKRECQRYVALMMRTQGYNYETIAGEMHISQSWAHALVSRGIKMRQKEPVETIRQMQIDRLEKLLAGVWDNAEGGDSFSIQSALSIMDRIDKAHGIEPPKRIEHTFTKEARNDAINGLAAKLAALSAEKSDSDGVTEPTDAIH